MKVQNINASALKWLKLSITAFFVVLNAAVDAQPNTKLNVVSKTSSIVSEAHTILSKYPSSSPYLTQDHNGIPMLSWIETTDSGQSSFRFSRWHQVGWGAAQTIASGDNWFINYADYPTIAESKTGQIAAQWLEKNSGGVYTYGIRMSLSDDQGKSWSAAMIPHQDRSAAQHGFMSILADEQSGFTLVWLDGRNKNPGQVGLRLTHLSADGTFSADESLDPLTCSCCRPTLVKTKTGKHVIYRDRSTAEIRDITAINIVGAERSLPKVVYPDGWEISACPVNGAAVASNNHSIAIAWFTSAHNQPRLKLAFSDDDGQSYRPPLIIDDGDPFGFTDIIVNDHYAIVSWIEGGPNGRELRIRRIDFDGTPYASQRISDYGHNAMIGFPQMTFTQYGNGAKVLLAWAKNTPKGSQVVSYLFTP